MIKIFPFSILLVFFSITQAQKNITQFEQSKGSKTATYFQTISFYQNLQKQFQTIQIKKIGLTDAGYPIHLILFSKQKDFNTDSWKLKNKVVILFNNGIHPGEPDGIDASMMLLRDLAEGRTQISNDVIIATIAIYNIGGSLNRSKFSRVNQNGPDEYGFRGNAQNLDLNRDFTKNDSKNAQSFAEIFHWLQPDILMDNHVSDGADYQHTMTLLTTQHNKLGLEVGELLDKKIEPSLYKLMNEKGWPMCPYVNFETANPDKGWMAFYDPPRYSSGYAALFQTIAFVPETHMLKPYKDRVKSTYDLMYSLIETSQLLKKEIKEAKRKSIATIKKQKEYPLSWRFDSSQSSKIIFKGYETEKQTSNVTQLPKVVFNHNKPFEREINFYKYFKPEKIVTAPKAYIIPQGWHKVISLLKNNAVIMQTLKKDSLIQVEKYTIEDYKSYPNSYEGHHKNFNVKTKTSIQKIQFLKGDYVIFVNQASNRYIVEMLEPTGDDSFFSWNFFDAILQQKEGFSDYRWEDVAEKYLNDNPALQEQLNQKRKQDPKFAASSRAQLDFIYKNSPYYEPAHLRYPVYRLLE
jgi:hypothetical protein